MQTKGVEHTLLIRETDSPAVHLNEALMAAFREEMRKHDFDPSMQALFSNPVQVLYERLWAGR